MMGCIGWVSASVGGRTECHNAVLGFCLSENRYAVRFEVPIRAEGHPRGRRTDLVIFRDAQREYVDVSITSLAGLSDTHLSAESWEKAKVKGYAKMDLLMKLLKLPRS